MKSTKNSAGIKKKIIGGFLLLLTLVFLSVFSVIKLATTLSPPDPGISSSVVKLTLTSNLLSSLIEADGQARAYISTGDSIYLMAFYNQQDKARQLVDSLIKGSVSNTNQYLRVVAVDSLIDLKETTYNNYFELRQNALEDKPINFAHIASRYKDTIITIPDKRINKSITQQITPREQVKKKGFFPRVWESITGKRKPDSVAQDHPEAIVKYDTISTYKRVQDNTLNQIRVQLNRYEKQKNLEKQLVAERELMLVQADQDIMNEIRAVLLLFEKEEIAKAITETEKSHKLLDNLWITALILAGAGLLTTIGFIILIWKDLARSAFYRRQSEEARSLAESLLKVKEQFLANMSHEIRTPLTSVIGFTERLSETPINQEQTKYLKYISSSSEHLLELINDLLDFSRIDSGKFTLDSKPINPEEIFEDAFETLASRAKEKGLEVILKQNLPDVLVNGDPLRLRQIVINLLGNSIKFTSQGKVLLQTKGELSSDPNFINLVIRVADTGIGIPEDKMNDIFEEFSQVDHSITRKYGGSGLGLAITRKLVEMMGGNISVVSRHGQGTIFTIKLTLPVSEVEVPKNTETVFISKDLSNVNILLAEDDPTTRLLLSDFLENYHAVIFSASDGIEALQLFKEDPSIFQLVITDIQMPGLSGTELVTSIKTLCQEQKLKTPTIVGLTAHADNSAIEMYKSIGMDYFILKPFRNKDLKDVFNSINLKSIENNQQLAKDDKPEIGEGKNLNSASIDDGNKHGNSTYLDFSSFKKFAGDDTDSLNRIIHSLTINIENTISQMKKAFKKKDLTNLSLLAHRMQPNIKLLGVIDTALKLRELEVTCKSETPDEKWIEIKMNESITSLEKVLSELLFHQPIKNINK